MSTRTKAAPTAIVRCAKCKATYDGYGREKCPSCGLVIASDDDFDEDTPPPKARPQGTPVPRHVELPPGEPVEELFLQWDKEGRVPAGCALGELTRDGYVLRAVAGPNAFGVRIGKGLSDARLKGWRVRVAVHAHAGRFPEVPRWFAVFEPEGGAE